MLGELAWLRCTGQVKPELIGDLRGLAGTAGRLVPEDLRAEVAKQLAALDAESKKDTHGPKTEAQRGDQPPLRGIPR